MEKEAKTFTIMSSPIGEKLSRFYLGDDAAWDEIFQEYYARMVKQLTRQFTNLSISDLEDIVSDWFTEKFAQLREERNRAEIQSEKQKLSPTETANRKIEYCSNKLNFDLERSFEPWLRTVLYRRAIDFYWEKTRRREDIFETDAATIEPSDGGDGADAIEFLIIMKEFKHHLCSVLDEKELLYFHIWSEYGWKADGETVRQIFKTHFKMDDISNAYITLIKQRFNRLCYLVCLRIEIDARELRERFFDSIISKKAERNFAAMENLFFDDMMRIIWKVFYEDVETREESKQKVSPVLWRHRETLVQRINTQNNILKEAFLYFRTRNQRPAFCRSIKIYADDIFGANTRNFFYGEEGDTGNE